MLTADCGLTSCLSKQVALWDTGGLERYDSMTSSYFHFCHGMILVYDPDPSEVSSVTALQEWIENALRYSRTESIILSLWANKANDEESHIEDSKELVALKENYKIPSSLHFKVSALSGKGIMEAFRTVIEAVTDNVPNQLQDLDEDYSFLRTDTASVTIVETPVVHEKKVCPKC